MSARRSEKAAEWFGENLSYTSLTTPTAKVKQNEQRILSHLPIKRLSSVNTKSAITVLKRMWRTLSPS